MRFVRTSELQINRSSIENGNFKFYSEDCRLSRVHFILSAFPYIVLFVNGALVNQNVGTTQTCMWQVSSTNLTCRIPAVHCHASVNDNNISICIAWRWKNRLLFFQVVLFHCECCCEGDYFRRFFATILLLHTFSLLSKHRRDMRRALHQVKNLFSWAGYSCTILVLFTYCLILKRGVLPL